jgi:hypothetical protein
MRSSIAVACAAVLAGAAGLAVALPNAVVTVHAPITVLTAGRSAADLGVASEHLSRAGEDTATATGHADGFRAHGVVRLSYKSGVLAPGTFQFGGGSGQAPAEVRLPTGSRLATCATRAREACGGAGPDLRLTADAVVPLNSSVEVAAEAAQPGPEGNINSHRAASVPGLSLVSGLELKVDNPAPFSGGAGPGPSPTAADVDQVARPIDKRLRASVNRTLRHQAAGAGRMLVDGPTVEARVTSTPPVGGPGARARVSVTVDVDARTASKDRAWAAAQANSKGRTPPGYVLVPDSLRVACQADTCTVSVVASSVDPADVRSAARGRSASGLRRWLASRHGAHADIRHWPAWCPVLALLPSRVRVHIASSGN